MVIWTTTAWTIPATGECVKDDLFMPPSRLMMSADCRKDMLDYCLDAFRLQNKK